MVLDGRGFVKSQEEGKVTRQPTGSAMALLLATDDWSKMRVYEEFLHSHGRAIWRTCLRHSRALRETSYPVSVYFFHRNLIKYRAHCIEIRRDCDWSLFDVPPEFRSERKQYTLYLVFDYLERVPDTPIDRFAKWSDPAQSFRRGVLGLPKVYDALCHEAAGPL